MNSKIRGDMTRIPVNMSGTRSVSAAPPVSGKPPNPATSPFPVVSTMLKRSRFSFGNSTSVASAPRSWCRSMACFRSMSVTIFPLTTTNSWPSSHGRTLSSAPPVPRISRSGEYRSSTPNALPSPSADVIDSG